MSQHACSNIRIKKMYTMLSFFGLMCFSAFNRWEEKYKEWKSQIKYQNIDCIICGYAHSTILYRSISKN